MLSYITLGTNDLARAAHFYDPVLATLSHIRLTADGSELGYGPQGADPIPLWVGLPYDGAPATRGNGSMICLAAPSRAAVDAFHAAALAHGGSDEGAPGLRRYGPHFYACYVRDPDGNKLSAVCETAE